MKKLLVIVSLVLAIATSLTAGTMAAYTTQVSAVSGEVTAKMFKITGEGSDTFRATNLSIGPGDAIWYKFTIKNESFDTSLASQSGISADVDFTAEIVGGLADVCKVELFRNENDKNNKFLSITNVQSNTASGNVVKTVLDENEIGYANKVGLRFVNMGIQGWRNGKAYQKDNSEVYVYMKITWPYNNDDESNERDNGTIFDENGNAKTPETLSLRVNVNAVSHNVHQKYDVNGNSANTMDLNRGKVEALAGAMDA